MHKLLTLIATFFIIQTFCQAQDFDFKIDFKVKKIINNEKFEGIIIDNVVLFAGEHITKQTLSLFSKNKYEVVIKILNSKYHRELFLEKK